MHQGTRTEPSARPARSPRYDGLEAAIGRIGRAVNMAVASRQSPVRQARPRRRGRQRRPDDRRHRASPGGRDRQPRSAGFPASRSWGGVSPSAGSLPSLRAQRARCCRATPDVGKGQSAAGDGVEHPCPHGGMKCPPACWATELLLLSAVLSRPEQARAPDAAQHVPHRSRATQFGGAVRCTRRTTSGEAFRIFVSGFKKPAAATLAKGRSRRS